MKRLIQRFFWPKTRFLDLLIRLLCHPKKLVAPCSEPHVSIVPSIGRVEKMVKIFMIPINSPTYEDHLVSLSHSSVTARLAVSGRSNFWVKWGGRKVWLRGPKNAFLAARADARADRQLAHRKGRLIRRSALSDYFSLCKWCVGLSGLNLYHVCHKVQRAFFALFAVFSCTWSWYSSDEAFANKKSSSKKGELSLEGELSIFLFFLSHIFRKSGTSKNSTCTLNRPEVGDVACKSPSKIRIHSCNPSVASVRLYLSSNLARHLDPTFLG